MTRIIAFIVFLMLPISALALDFSDRNGMLVMEGEIRPGDSERFDEALANWNDPPSAFYINSPGGSVIDAMSIGQFIRGSRIPVLSGQLCASACVYMYAAGVQRTIYRTNGRLGLHRPKFLEHHFSSLNQIDAEERYKELINLSRAYLIQMGVKNSIIEDIHSIPSSEMRYLDPTDAYDAFGFRLPFYEEWLASICGRATKEDLLLVQSLRAWNEIQSFPKERIEDFDEEVNSLVELAKPALALKEMGKLDEAVSRMRERTDCENRAAQTYTEPYFKLWQEGADALVE